LLLFFKKEVLAFLLYLLMASLPDHRKSNREGAKTAKVREGGNT
jgi:hypothetical protein